MPRLVAADDGVIVAITRNLSVMVNRCQGKICLLANRGLNDALNELEGGKLSNKAFCVFRHRVFLQLTPEGMNENRW